MIASVLGVGVLAGAFLAMAVVVYETNELVGLDRLAHRVRRAGPVDALVADGGSLGLNTRLRAREVVHLGARTPVILMAFALALTALIWRDRLGAFVAIVGPGMTGALTEYVIKPLVNAPSPVGARAFPSGHAGGVAAVGLVAVILVYRRWGRLASLLATPPVVILVMLVAWALLRLDFHYPTDVLGGVILAATVVLGLTAALALYRGPGHRLFLPKIGTRRARSGTASDLRDHDRVLPPRTD